MTHSLFIAGPTAGPMDTFPQAEHELTKTLLSMQLLTVDFGYDVIELNPKKRANWFVTRPIEAGDARDSAIRQGSVILRPQPGLPAAPGNAQKIATGRFLIDGSVQSLTAYALPPGA